MTESTPEYFNEGTPFKFTSPSMGVDTKPAHRFMVGEFWVLVDPKMPEEQFETIKAAATLWETIKNLELDAYPKLKEKHLNAMKLNEDHVNNLVKRVEQLQAEIKFKEERLSLVESKFYNLVDEEKYNSLMPKESGGRRTGDYRIGLEKSKDLFEIAIKGE